ncbi:MAG: hypothetical protein ACP5T9_05200, partial [Thermoplasmata archaeon]
MDLIIRTVQWKDFEDIANNYFSYYDEKNSNENLGLIFKDKAININDEIKWFSNLMIQINK